LKHSKGMAPFWRQALALAALALPLCFCGRGAGTFSDAPVILVTVDTLRSDRLSVYGYEALATPAFEALAADGVTFDRAYAPIPLTLPSHATIMTGLLPPRHGVRDNTGYALGEDFQTLAERLQGEGYDTAAFVSSMVLRRATGMAQGFDVYDDSFDAGEPGLVSRFAERRGDVTLSAAKRWLGNRAERPFFLWVHLYDPHAPYAPPKPYSATYDGETAYTDSLLGRFFDTLKEQDLYDRALVIVASDHGEGLGDHGEKEHGMLLYREALQVPLLVKYPGRAQAGIRVDRPVDLSDLRPTVETALGLEPAESDGFPLVDPGASPRDRALYAESLYAQLHFGWHAQKSAIREALHLIEGGETELYDLIEDPGETRNLYGSKGIPDAMTQAIEKWGEGASATVAVSEEDRAMLASLGYTGGFDLGDSVKALTFPELIQLKETVADCERDIAGGRYAQAQEKLEGLLLKTPDLQDAKALLAIALKAQDKREDAERMLMEALAGAPSDANLLAHLADVKLALDKRQDAAAAARKAAESDPVAAARALLPKFFEARMMPAAAFLAERAAAVDPDQAYARFVLGRTAAMQGDPKTAVDHLEHAAELFGESRQTRLLVSALVFLSESYEQLGEREQALSALERALETEPGIAQTRSVLADFYWRAERRDQAVGLLEEGLALASGDPGLTSQLASFKLRLGERDEAARLAERALAVNADAAAGPLCYAFVKFAPPELAREIAAKAASGAPASPYPPYVQARLDHAERKYGSARVKLRDTLEKIKARPDLQLLSDTLYYLGDVEASTGNADQARAYFHQAVNVDPRSPRNQIALAALYIKAGDPERGVALLDAWLERFPAKQNYLTAHQVLTDLKLPEKAAAYLQKAQGM